MKTTLTHGLSRRGFLVSSASLAASAAFPARSLFAQAVQASAPPSFVDQARAAAATAKITAQSLRGGVSVLMGSGGNIGVLPGKDGKVLVDSGYSSSKPQLLQALAAISSDPMTMLINTHWHFDHTDGNEWMHAAGATILAQEKTKERLSTPQDIAAFHVHLPAAPAGAIPTRTFVSAQTLKANGETIVLTHYDPAHTDTDASVLFTNANVLHAGDTWFNGFYPFIDYSSGGNIDGMIRASEKNLATASAETIIIPGHGPIGNKAQLSEFRDMLVGVRAKVAAAKQQGKDVEATIAAQPTAAYDAKFGKGFLTPDVFVRLVYQGV